jgi:hypothetical protein
MSRRRPDLVWDGQSRPSLRTDASGVPGGSSNSWMCAEDLALEIWTHLRGTRDTVGTRHVAPLWLDDCSEEMRIILVNSLPYTQHRDELTEAVAAFARMVAQSLVAEGSIAFEVQRGWHRSDQKNSKLEGARLLYIDRNSMIKLGPWSYQIASNAVPYDNLNEDAGTKHVIPLDAQRIVTFRPPRQYRKALDQMRAGFRSIANSEQRWMLNFAGKGEQEDFACVKRAYTIQVARLCAPIGWNARGLFHDYIADFHYFCRHLRWLRFCIEIRDSILTTLSESFELIGGWRGENPKLRWGHLPTIQDVQESQAKLMGGDTRFDEILKPFKRDGGE